MSKVPCILLALCLVLLPAAAEPPLTLGEAARSALERHPDLRVAQADVVLSEVRRDRAGAPYYPSLSGTVGVSHSESVGNSGGVNITRVGDFETYGVGFQARYTVADFGRRSNASKAAEEGVVAAQDDYLNTRQELLLTVVDAFFNVLREQESVEIQTENVANARARLEQAQAFVEVGVRAKIEVTRAQTDLAQAELGLIQARNAELRARTNLAAAMGVGEPVTAPLSDSRLNDPQWEVETAYARALKTRPDVLAILARVESARASVRAAEADYNPSLAASASYNLRDQMFFPIARSWNVGLDLTFPIFNEPTLWAAVAEAEGQLVRLQAQQDALLLEVRRQVTEAVLNLQESRERLKASVVASASARENFRLASERYQVGVGSALEVSDAQRVLVEAESQEAQARLDLERAIARVYRNTGTLEPDLLGTGVTPGVAK
ncbi:MAG: TolC family protein [Candidatus Eremiobacterota bacterium]